MQVTYIKQVKSGNITVLHPTISLPACLPLDHPSFAEQKVIYFMRKSVPLVPLPCSCVVRADFSVFQFIATMPKMTSIFLSISADLSPVGHFVGEDGVKRDLLDYNIPSGVQVFKQWCSMLCQLGNNFDGFDLGSLASALSQVSFAVGRFPPAATAC